MNNQADMSFSVSANISPLYTATHFYSGIPIIKNIILKNIPDVSDSGIVINITAKALGDDNVYFLDGETLFGKKDREICTVEGIHPNDLGFYRIAEGIYKLYEQIDKNFV